MFNLKLILIFCILIFSAKFNFLYAINRTLQTYEVSDSIIANPERGLQKYSITDANYYSNTDYSNLDKSELISWRTGVDKVTVIFRYFLLDEFLEKDISSVYIQNIENDFKIIREAGLKCIVRFSYSNEQSLSQQQPVKSLLLKHIEQLRLVLEENKDIILSHQAGFLGTWGEWYYTNSTEFGTDGNITDTQWNNRKEIIDAMLLYTPIEIPLQVRYPEIKMRMYGTTLLNEVTAYKNSPNGRIGFFNDAFLNNWGDMGTFSVDSELENPVGTEDYVYLANETKYVPMTGETNGINTPRTNGDNALFEMDSCNWTNLNRDYYTANWINWIASGDYDNILKGLGYRFVLKSSSFEVKEDKLNIGLQIENVGFARLFKKRDVNIILINKESSDGYNFKLLSDPRTWESNVIINETLNISSVPKGNYSSYLQLPDPDSSLSKREEYCIQFANKDIWIKSLGNNNLNQEVSVTSTAVYPIQSGNQFNSKKHLIKSYPNPFSESVQIKYYCSKPENVSADIYNLTGKLVKGMVDKNTGVGWSQFVWNGTDEGNDYVTCGIYIIKIKADSKTIVSTLYMIE